LFSAGSQFGFINLVECELYSLFLNEKLIPPKKRKKKEKEINKRTTKE
jgi:hypothetical protein